MAWILSGREGDGWYKDYDHYTLYRGDETANLLSDYARRFPIESAACRAATPGSGAPSQFVRVRRPGQAPERVAQAFGWISSG
jgi:hypothetical protein